MQNDKETGVIEPDGNTGQLTSLILSVREQLILLAMSGLAGAVFRALLAPQEAWKLRVAQGLGGALSAIFLGGFAAQITDSIVDVGPYAWLAWGFIMGTGGEVAVKYIQDKLMK